MTSLAALVDLSWLMALLQEKPTFQQSCPCQSSTGQQSFFCKDCMLGFFFCESCNNHSRDHQGHQVLQNLDPIVYIDRESQEKQYGSSNRNKSGHEGRERDHFDINNVATKRRGTTAAQEGYQFDYVFDWTVLKCPQIGGSSKGWHPSGRADKRRSSSRYDSTSRRAVAASRPASSSGEPSDIQQNRLVSSGGRMYVYHTKNPTSLWGQNI
ncbi:Uncharacterized protein TCM_030778 [Theobroma cacao]|uniref:C2H2-type domain-containing protein n=1 Tax=Theobroma cacao TaxID=3641 RepID=A0A061FCM1_THECC|nr:Uncharacterized protein TCM_030778 [Theobroma cacao]